jgi:hypothetical protein
MRLPCKIYTISLVNIANKNSYLKNQIVLCLDDWIRTSGRALPMRLFLFSYYCYSISFSSIMQLFVIKQPAKDSLLSVLVYIVELGQNQQPE